MASYAGLTVSTGNAITATWGNGVRDSVLNVFASAAARSSAITAPTEGMITYLSDSDRIDLYDGTAWQLLGFAAGLLFARKTADESISLSTTFQNDDALSLTVAANAVYEGHLHLIYSSGTTPDFKMQLSLPASATATNWSFAGVNATAATTINVAGVGAGVAGLGGTGGDQTVDLWGLLVTAGTAGTAVLQWAQNTGDAGTTSVKAGSFFSLRRVG